MDHCGAAYCYRGAKLGCRFNHDSGMSFEHLWTVIDDTDSQYFRAERFRAAETEETATLMSFSIPEGSVVNPGLGSSGSQFGSSIFIAPEDSVSVVAERTG
eukprot:3990769-Karenia_brevis.AAC.1